MQIILVVVHLFLAIGLVGLILIQHGKGADMGAAFGSGASATSNFSALRAAQKSAGIGSVKSDRFSSNRSLVLTPGIFETTVG